MEYEILVITVVQDRHRSGVRRMSLLFRDRTLISALASREFAMSGLLHLLRDPPLHICLPNSTSGPFAVLALVLSRKTTICPSRLLAASQVDDLNVLVRGHQLLRALQHSVPAENMRTLMMSRWETASSRMITSLRLRVSEA